MFPNLPWDWLGLSFNENITWDIVKSNPDKNWQYRGLSLNPNITPDIILENKELPWNFYNLSSNKFTKSDNIKKKIIKNNREKRRMLVRMINRILKIDNRLYNDLISFISSIL
jgi:hypothetical protein